MATRHLGLSISRTVTNKPVAISALPAAAAFALAAPAIAANPIAPADDYLLTRCGFVGFPSPNGGERIGLPFPLGKQRQRLGLPVDRDASVLLSVIASRVGRYAG